MSTLSTHILDISRGKPAAGVAMTLERLEGEDAILLGKGLTDDNGRISAFTDQPLAPGRYRLRAGIGDWFRQRGQESLYLSAQIDFAIVGDGAEHYHLPFLISPGSWSTYRGS